MTTSNSSRKGLWANYVPEFRLGAPLVEGDRRTELTGPTQLALANQVGIAQTTIAAIENGIISGRGYMDSIATHLGVTDPGLIFPYYGYVSSSEAAREFSLPAHAITLKVNEGELPHEVFGGMKLIPRTAFTPEVIGSLKIEPRNPNVREFVREALQQNGNGGLTSDALLALGETPEEREHKAILTEDIATLSGCIDDLRVQLRTDPSIDRAEALNEIHILKEECSRLRRERDKKKQTIQSILSRSVEFYSDKSQTPPRWRLNPDSIAS